MTLPSPVAIPATVPVSVAPGWYADPMAPGHARWWSGRDWTHHVQPHPSGAYGVANDSWSATNLLVPQQRSLAVRSLVWGIVAVVIDPLLAPSILAIVFGIMALNRGKRLMAQGFTPLGRSRAIAGIVLGSIGAVGAIFWFALFLSFAPRN
ncbi:MAG: DUF4190 domain-containing protein [Actinomycetota bacterium]|nr:DUF4190 domain-containing protein [Actinomycetota bacterium]